MREASARRPASTVSVGRACQVAVAKASPRASVTRTLAAGRAIGAPFSA